MSQCVLVVDDFGGIRKLLGSKLKEAGYDVVEAENGADALLKLELRPINLVITDLNMPVLDGIGLVKVVRAKPKYRFVPMIMISSESREAKSSEFRSVVTAWLNKPFDPEKLVKLVRKVLG